MASVFLFVWSNIMILTLLTKKVPKIALLCDFWQKSTWQAEPRDLSDNPKEIAGGIENNVIVDMSFICMCWYGKGMPPFGKPHGKFVAYFVAFFRCDLPGLERLPDLIGNNISLIFPAGCFLVLTPGKKKFFCCCFRLTLIRWDECPVFRLIRILWIIDPLMHAGGYRTKLGC